jgi:sortase A
MFARFRLAGRFVVACLLCLGFWQLGQGAYIPAKAWLAQELMQRAWDRTGNGHSRATPWPWADTWPVARLTARSGDIDLIILAGGSGRTLAFGPGHLSASALPGELGNAVIAGHRDTHFQFLEDVELGELLNVESSKGLRHLYKVVSIDIVDSRKGSLLLDTDVAMLSLVTCYPFAARETGGPLRYVVTAKMLY